MQIGINKEFRYISSVGMLVNTNDSFFGFNGVDVFRKKSGSMAVAPAYDAGTEENNEDWAFIPGPFCTDSTSGGADEGGVVLINNGVHGIGDLIPEMHDWRNPVALIVIIQTGGIGGR